MKKAERKHLSFEYQQLFDQLSDILFRHDPIGINDETNTDEYGPEVGTILPKLKYCNSVTDVKHLIDQEFRYWFAGIYFGPDSRLDLIAKEIWDLWKDSEIRTRTSTNQD